MSTSAGQKIVTSSPPSPSSFPPPHSVCPELTVLPAELGENGADQEAARVFFFLLRAGACLSRPLSALRGCLVHFVTVRGKKKSLFTHSQNRVEDFSDADLKLSACDSYKLSAC